MGRSINAAGLALVKHFEGKFNNAYYCPASVLTIGYGHTNDMKTNHFTEDDEWTDAQCEEVLAIDLAECGEAVERLVKVTLTGNQYAALCSFVFNLGASSLASSTLLKKLNQGDYEDAANWFLPWNKARVQGKMTVMLGLKRRREAERELFLND